MKRLIVSAIAAVAVNMAFAQNEAYLFAYFSDKGYGGRRGEAAGMRLAYSYDGLKWTALNGEKPFLVPEVGKAKLLRDPSICRGPDGTFHVVWTTIDAALVRVGGRWLMTVKNENDDTGPGHPAEKNIRAVWTDNLGEPWEGKAISNPINFTRDWVEGPSPLIVGGEIYVYFDCYMKHRYGAVKSSDGGKTWRDVSSEVNFPKGVRHGTAFTVQKELVDALVGRYAANEG